ncbi:phosphoribosylformylglycinamidin [Phlegmacium glaucopus]|nr:phosphoribosylformylglycinamidin [Phlegmacium glaucopus]
MPHASDGTQLLDGTGDRELARTIGSSSISKPKRQTLLRNIQKSCPKIISVDAVWVHWVHCRSPKLEKEVSDPTSKFEALLDRLLTYGDDVRLDGTTEALAKQRNLAYILPLPGSISPWSTNVTDIAVLCQLGDHIKRVERGTIFVFTTKGDQNITKCDISTFSQHIHDRMTQIVRLSPPQKDSLFLHQEPRPLRIVDLQSSTFIAEDARAKLISVNAEMGLALATDEINYLVDAYITGGSAMNRNPTDAELFMFAQVNSEHCRHKIFNASWTIDKKPLPSSLFQMIRNTEKLNGTGTISAYSDNAAVLEGHPAPRFSAVRTSNSTHLYQSTWEDIPILIKVETHNHPTAVSPYPGGATGSGGEIRDEGAVGRGSKPKAGLCGFTVSNLLIPGYEQPWETDFGRPAHIASAFDIMMEGPLGASDFNNEFGRPALTGYFRTFSESVPISKDGSLREVRGYHKPIMIAGGYGNVRPQFARKALISPGAKIVVLGGPGQLIGLGGGAAASQVSGAITAELDFAAVHRDNAEMQRRCQQDNPIQSIHDVSSGGLSNALPELVHDSGLDVLTSDSSMSPMEIWCNETVDVDKVEAERCPFSIVGVAAAEEDLIVTDRLCNKDVIRLKMSTLFGKPPKMSRKDVTRRIDRPDFDSSLARYLPSIKTLTERLSSTIELGSKSFLITIGDRTVTGLVTRDQMVGPWQVPVADVAVTRSSYGFDVICGEAMAMGERTPIALLNAAASARMAVAESLTNLVAATLCDLSRIKLSANWMCAASKEGEGAALYEAVEAVGMDLCPALGDSMYMSMKWKDGQEEKEVSSPLSLIVTAFAPVRDVGTTWTPQLRSDLGTTSLVFFDLANCKQRLGGSALAQVFKEIGNEAPDVESPAVLKAFLQGCQDAKINAPGLVLAYHDRSDGGLFTTIVEMCFAGRVGAEIFLSALDGAEDPISTLFNEELGAVVQVRESDFCRLMNTFNNAGFPSASIHVIGRVTKDQMISFIHESSTIYRAHRSKLQKIWSETSFRMQSLRDNADAAQEEFDLISDESQTGIFYNLKFPKVPFPVFETRPKVAILREQGVNGQLEMAWAFTEAGFDAVDVHMSDILKGDVSLCDFRGLVACGGFSYGDVFGAGKGWANSSLLNNIAHREFSDFFTRETTFTLGVCNGCQFLSHLREIIPGTEEWPEFKPNQTERFEGRVSMVEIVDNEVTRNSVFLSGMAGSMLPVAVAHGEGRASFSASSQKDALESQNLVAVRFVDSAGRPTEVYPLNPNGSPAGITGVQTSDGRILALMPHPERVVALESNSWYPASIKRHWDGMGPWFKLFQNARRWCS